MKSQSAFGKWKSENQACWTQTSQKIQKELQKCIKKKFKKFKKYVSST